MLSQVAGASVARDDPSAAGEVPRLQSVLTRGRTHVCVGLSWGAARPGKLENLSRPPAVGSPKPLCLQWNRQERRSHSNLCSPFEGLPTEGLFHRHPGATGTHGGRLLEDGVGVEVPHGRDADGGPGERAGQGRSWPAWALRGAVCTHGGPARLHHPGGPAVNGPPAVSC